MTTLYDVQDRIRPGAALFMLAIIGAGTYLEFVYFGPPTLYTVLLWIVVVPMLLAATVRGVRTHPRYQPLMYGGFVAIGTLQYLEGDWVLLAGLFIAGGIIGLISELRN